MKNYGALLLAYNLLCLLVLKTEWYSQKINMYIPFCGIVTDYRYNFIDFYDTPFYMLGVAIFVYFFKKLSLLQKTYFFTNIVYLFFKVLNSSFFNLGLNDFLAINFFIIIAIPFSVWLLKKFHHK